MPLYDLPIVVEARGRRLEARSDAEGRFEIAGLPVGLHAGSSSHLRFQVPVAEGVTIVELGTLKVPLTHPPSGWWWQPSELPSLAALAAEAEAIDFVGCFEDPGWRRPSRAEQARAVWSRGPFASEPPERLEAGFDRPGFLFTTVDRFMQSLPGGLDLGPLGAEQRFALGLWTGADPISGSTCDYRPATLDALVRGERLEVWLLGYRALAVRRRLRIFDPPVTPRVEGDKDGDPVVWSEARFAVYVEPAEGFSVIRFAGIDTSGSPLALHLIEGDRELAELSGLDP